MACRSASGHGRRRVPPHIPALVLRRSHSLIISPHDEPRCPGSAPSDLHASRCWIPTLILLATSGASHDVSAARSPNRGCASALADIGWTRSVCPIWGYGTLRLVLDISKSWARQCRLRFHSGGGRGKSNRAPARYSSVSSLCWPGVFWIDETNETPARGSSGGLAGYVAREPGPGIRGGWDGGQSSVRRGILAGPGAEREQKGSPAGSWGENGAGLDPKEFGIPAEYRCRGL